MTATFLRPDATGRSSSTLMPREKKLTSIPAPFVAIPAEVVRSDAFRTLGIHSRRVLDALLIEHVNHRLTENGRLIATYDQLEKDYGVPRRKIAHAIRDLEERGLIERTAVGCGNRLHGQRSPSRYRLTFLHSLPDRIYASNKWRQYKAQRRARKTDRPVPLPDAEGSHMVAPLWVSQDGTHGG